MTGASEWGKRLAAWVLLIILGTHAHVSTWLYSPLAPYSWSLKLINYWLWLTAPLSGCSSTFMLRFAQSVSSLFGKIEFSLKIEFYKNYRRLDLISSQEHEDIVENKTAKYFLADISEHISPIWHVFHRVNLVFRVYPKVVLKNIFVHIFQ